MTSIGKDCVIDPSVKFLAESVTIGDFAKIKAGVVFVGGEIEIGRDAYIGENVLIGGGRADMGSLKTGDFLHLGKGSMINIADKVTIGDEVGIGMDGRIFTHGAYLSEWDGFPYKSAPVNIGSHVWLPYAIVNPGVGIGDNVVVAAMSLVNESLPAGCLAGGIPARIIKDNCYPKVLSTFEQITILKDIINDARWYGLRAKIDEDRLGIIVETTHFTIPERIIDGPADIDTEKMKDLLRRHGIRFRYANVGGVYKAWDDL
jgi:acetyltransferase-like isoleucine patch superfamily enzyme